MTTVGSQDTTGQLDDDDDESDYDDDYCCDIHDDYDHSRHHIYVCIWV